MIMGAALLGMSVLLAQDDKQGRAHAAVPANEILAEHGTKKTAVMRAKPWGVQAEKLSCRLTQEFGRADEAVTLSVDQPVTLGSAQWAVVGKMMANAPGELMVRVSKRSGSPVQAEPKGKIFYAKAYWVDDVGNAEWTWVDDASPTSLTGTAQLEIEAAHLPPFRLDARSLAQGSAALVECVKRQRGALGWNEDVVEKPEPTTNPGRWATSDDYPARAMRDGAEGTSSFLLMISDTGVVSDCHIVGSSLHDALDSQTCALMMERGAFHPAKDAAGKAVPSQYHNRIRWTLPQATAEE